MVETPKKHIYHGSGKGKTTAAAGLCARAVTYGNRVLFCSFLKDNSSGEIASLKKLGIDAECVCSSRFTWLLSAEEMIALKSNVKKFFDKIDSVADNYDLIVLDEVLDAVNEGLLPEEDLISFLKKHPNAEIVMTGRDPSERLVGIADYVTEMKMQKHPFNNNIAAREGIEK